MSRRMKKFVIVVVSLLLFRSAYAQDSLKLTLSQAIDIALSESPTIKVANKEIKKVEYSKKEKVGGLLPNISLGASYVRTLKKQKMFFSIPGMPANPDGFEVGQDNTFNGSTNGISAALPLVAPALWQTIHMSQYDLELALENARSSKINLVNQVQKAYYSLLLTQDSYNVINRTYANTQENDRIIKNKFKQGTVSEFETIRSDVQLRNVSANLTAAANGMELAKLQLKMLMGIDMDTPISVDGKLSDYESNMFADYMKIDTTALALNSDMKKFEIQSKQLYQTLKIQRASYLPTLSASINYNYMSMVNDEYTFTKNQKWFPTSNVGVVLQIPIFQGGQRYYKEKQLRTQISELDDQKKSLQQGLQLQAMSYMNNMQKAMKLIESNKEALRQADKAMEISKKMYEVGGGTYLDVTNAELGYLQAGLAYNQAIYDYLSAKSDLDKLLGKTF